MRIGATMIHTSVSTSSSSQSSFAAPPPLIYSPSGTPVLPYLFGGLAAMLFLITFALLILACSSWRLSVFFSSNRGRSTGKSTEEEEEEQEESVKTVYGEQIGVIMAGDVKPSYLATLAPIYFYNPSSFEKSVDDDTVINIEDETRRSLDEKPKEEEESEMITVEAESGEAPENLHHQQHQSQ